VRRDYQESTLASRPRRGCHDYDYDHHHDYHDDVNNDHDHLDNCPANHHLHVFDDLGPHE